MKKNIVFIAFVLVAILGLGAVLLKSYGARVDAERMTQGLDALFRAANIESDLPLNRWPDSVREFLAASMHADVDMPLNTSSADWIKTISAILEYRQNTGGELSPGINPATMAQLMGLMLQRANVDARIVEIFRYAPGFPSIPMVETRDPDTGAWVLHDPARNLYWADPTQNIRVGLDTLIKSHAQGMMPCDLKQCNWALVEQTGIKMADMTDYFVMGVAYDPTDPVVYINGEQFSFTQPVTMTDGSVQSFCQTHNHICALRQVEF